MRTAAALACLIAACPAWGENIKRPYGGTACLGDRPQDRGCIEGIIVRVQRRGRADRCATVNRGEFTFQLDPSPPNDPWRIAATYTEVVDSKQVFYMVTRKRPLVVDRPDGPAIKEDLKLSSLDGPPTTLGTLVLHRLPDVDWDVIAPGGPSADAEEPQQQSAPTRTQTVRLVIRSEKPEGVLRGATVSLAPLKGEAGIELVTGADGAFQATLPVPSSYAVTVMAAGYEGQSLVLVVSERGAAISDSGGAWEKAETITLAAAEAEGGRELEMDGARRGSYDSALMEALPLAPVRTPDVFALLEPGVLPAPGIYARRGPGIGPGLGAAGSFSVNGLRTRENNFTVDGSDNNDEDSGVRRQGFLLPLAQTIESLQVFQITTANADARFGRTIGGQVNIVSKLAGNGVHGEVYGFLGDSRWNARGHFNASGAAAGASGGRLAITANGLPGGAPVSIDSGPFALPGIQGGSAATQSAPDFRKDPNTRANFGAAAGGPIVANRTYVFGAFERVLTRASRMEHFATPTVSERALPRAASGLFPATLSGNAVFSLYPFPNNAAGPYGANTYSARLPADGAGNIFSVKFDHGLTKRRATALMMRFNATNEGQTLPQVGGAIASSVRPIGSTQNAVAVLTTAVTGTLSNNFFFSYGRTHSNFHEVRDPSLLPSTFFPRQPFLLNRPMLLNVATDGGPARYVSSVTPTGQALVAGAFGGFVDRTGTTEPYLGAIGELRIAGFSPVGLDSYRFPQERNQQTFQWSDIFYYRRGRHTLQGGFDLRRLQLDTITARNNRPLLAFHGLRLLPPQSGIPDAGAQPLFSPLELAAGGYSAGLMQTLSTTDDFSLRLHRTTVDAFFVDQFRATPRLQFIVGIRLEFNRLPKDLDPRLRLAFDGDAFAREVEKAQAACRATQGDPRNCLDVVSGAQSQLSGDLRRTYGQDRVGNDPRGAFAWDVRGNGTTVARGGFGVYTAQFPAIVLNESRSTFPSFAPLNLGVNFASLIGTANFATAATSGRRIEGTLGQINTADPRTPNLLAVVAQRFGGALQLTQPADGIKNPYAYHFNLTLEHRLGRGVGVEAAYVGTAARHLLRAWTPHGGAFLRGVRAFQGVASFPGFSPFPSYGAFPPQDTPPGEQYGLLAVRRTLLEGTANSSFHSLQAQLYRTAGGVQFRSALTYGHAIDDASDFLDLPGSEALPQNSFRRSERGDSSYDTRVRSVTYWNYEMRLRQSRRWLSSWQTSGILTLQTGQPFNVISVYDWNADGNLTDRPQNPENIVRGPIGGDRRTVLEPRNPALDLPTRDASGAFSYADSPLGRNAWRAGGIANLDLGLTMAVFQQESVRVRFRAEAYNVFNRPHFGIPVRMAEAPGFGQSVSTTVPNREIQFALKIGW